MGFRATFLSWIFPSDFLGGTRRKGSKQACTKVGVAPLVRVDFYVENLVLSLRLNACDRLATEKASQMSLTICCGDWNGRHLRSEYSVWNIGDKQQPTLGSPSSR